MQSPGIFLSKNIQPNIFLLSSSTLHMFLRQLPDLNTKEGEPSNELLIQ